MVKLLRTYVELRSLKDGKREYHGKLVFAADVQDVLYVLENYGLRMFRVPTKARAKKGKRK